MCTTLFGGGAPKTAAPQRIAAPSSDAGQRQGELEARLRRARSGAAADVLTSPLGVTGAGVSKLGLAA